MKNIINPLKERRFSFSDDDSITIEYMRFPLAIAVVLIHSFGSPISNLQALQQNPFTLENLFHFFRIAVSHVGTHFAVPAFFCISGFLFLKKNSTWNFQIYKSKIKKIFRTLFLPYIFWISLFILPGFISSFYLSIFFSHDYFPLQNFIKSIGGLHAFWDSISWGGNYTNWLGTPLYSSGPAIGPLYFLRDLMVTILISPILYFSIVKTGCIGTITLGFCYLSHIWPSFPGFSIESIFWFCLGLHLAVTHKSITNSFRSFKRPAIILCTILFPILVWNNGRIGDGLSTNQATQIIYPFFVFSSLILFFLLAHKIASSGKFKIVTKFSTFSFFLYITHFQILQKINYLMQNQPFYISYFLTPLLVILVSLFLYILMCNLTPRCFSFLTGQRG